MLIIDDLLFWLPAKGLLGIAREIQSMADQEMANRQHNLKKRMAQNDNLVKTGRINQQEYFKRQNKIMNEINRQKI